MTETWREKLTREAREMDAALRPVLASSVDDKALRDQLEALAQKPHFADFTWLWGPELAKRNRVLFRPFILSSFSSFSLNSKGDSFDAWKGETAAALERWLKDADAADDIELTRRLLGWRLAHVPWKDRERTWRDELVRRFAAARSPSARFTVLAKWDTGWCSLDARAAMALYQTDKAASRAFILNHLPWFGGSNQNRSDWGELLQKSQAQDPDFHFELYRRIVDETQWQRDVLELCRTTKHAAALDSELERRHPRSLLSGAAGIFFELLRLRKRDVVPYILRHAESITPRYGFMGQREAKGLPDLLHFSYKEGWLDLWGTLLRTSATTELFDTEVRRLVQSTALSEADTTSRLLLIAGPGREAHFPGISFARVHPLEEETALALYRRFPDLVRGPFRMHIAPGWHHGYPKMVRAALERNDTELADYFASRAGIQVLSWGNARGWKEAIEILSSHYEALPDGEFVHRASNAMSRMPAFAVWNYDELLRSNPLARLLFERSTSLYLSSERAVRDLLESPQIHVQVLAFRILGKADPRACAIAAANADLLQATLLRPLHRRTRLLAFAALENAAAHDETTARYLLGRMKEALALPEKRYPTEKLVGLIAKILHRHPFLRSPAEHPRIYAEAGP